MNENDEIFLAMAESRQHVPLSPIDEAKNFYRLKRMGLTSQEIAKMISYGRNSEYVSRRLRLLLLDESAQKLVHTGEMTPTKALQTLRGHRFRET